MPEPTSSSASAAGFAAYKALGGAATMLGIGAALEAAVHVADTHRAVKAIEWPATNR